ncbi:hypothetical protein LZZ90_10875 [Flavobacterium sp. SM15]|uniref:hypothetical protein n=1 Tax=Flavobacterium sp. SM15 TaxID=2908005 RepID=UPI001EDAD997|nr:hypothetical protein [Flavobacterium sp. SM15]MCG2612010.1 hypothetical protein [Flavobacterium sp. SM15]
MKTVLYILFFLSFNLNAQIQNEFYVDDVENIEYLTVNFCVNNEGKTDKVTIIPSKTTYKNQDIINQVVEYRKSIEYYPDTNLKNNCYDFTFNFVNSKLQNSQLNENDIKLISNFKSGKFKYSGIIFPNATITRTNEYQIEQNGNEVFKYKIEWTNPYSYTITYLEVNQKEYEYLIGEKINVEIIKIVNPKKYIYKSNLLDRTIVTGIIEKLD